jgi:hypothetical protein
MKYVFLVGEYKIETTKEPRRGNPVIIIETLNQFAIHSLDKQDFKMLQY